jgi:hypothetical protein
LSSSFDVSGKRWLGAFAFEYSFLVGMSVSSWVEESITEGNSEKKQVG